MEQLPTTAINLHTHFRSTRGILNLLPQDNIPDIGYFSIGIHPWHITNWQEQLADLQTKSRHERCLAIGECGLDRKCETSIIDQQKAFIAQIEIANTLRKPLIIHCVKSYDLLANVFKYNPPNVPVIIHGFNQKSNVLSPLSTCNIYLSLGKASLIKNSNAQKALHHHPLNHIFLETDDDINLSIEEVYKNTSNLLNLPPEILIKQIEANFKHVFNVEF